MMIFTNTEIMNAAKNTARDIEAYCENSDHISVYGIPRGGIPAAYAVFCFIDHHKYVLVDNPDDADIFIDDLIDSGETRERFSCTHPGVKMFTLFEKTTDEWFVFPWEAELEKSIEDAVLRICQFSGKTSDEIMNFLK